MPVASKNISLADGPESGQGKEKEKLKHTAAKNYEQVCSAINRKTSDVQRSVGGWNSM